MALSPTQEAERIESLLSYQILDTGQEDSFDLVTGLVAEMLSVPHCCVSLVDTDRVWFKSALGLDSPEVPRELGFCATLVTSDQDLRHIEDAREDPETMQNSLVQGEGGIRFYVGAPLSSPEGHRIGTLCAFGPTPRKLSEPEQKSVLNLANLVMHGIELRKTQRRLERTERALRQSERLESVGMVASGVAHDVNNLLGGILGNAELLKLQLTDDEEANELLDGIETTGQRAADLVGEVLAYAGKEEQIPPRPVELNTLLCETQELLGSTTDAEVRFELDLEPELPLVSGRSTGLRQVVMNLLSNAAQVCSDIEGTVRISTSFDHASQRVLLRISDNGPGMTEEVKARLFEPFFSSRTGGRGLGLSICARIVEQHGGEISVESKLGRGSTFLVALPTATHAEQSPSKRPAIGTVARDQQARVLVVDDESCIANVVQRMLQNLGYEVLAASGGAEAIELLREHGASLSSMILDWSMPIVDGRQVLETMQSEGIDVPVVLTSGHSKENALRGIDGLPISAFLKKPFKLAELAELVEPLGKKPS